VIFSERFIDAANPWAESIFVPTFTEHELTATTEAIPAADVVPNGEQSNYWFDIMFGIYGSSYPQ